MPMIENTEQQTRILRFIETPRESYPYIRQTPGRSSVAPASPPATRKHRTVDSAHFQEPAYHLSAACSPSINFCTFFLPNGSSNPPATDISRPKICASPCQMTLVPPSTGERSNPAVNETFPPATLPCPLYCARLGRSAATSSTFTSATPLIYAIPTLTFTVK